MNNVAYGHLDDTTRAVWRHFLLLSFVFIRFKNWSPFTSVVVDLAATLFTPETPKVFSGLKHFTYPSIGIGVSEFPLLNPRFEHELFFADKIIYFEILGFTTTACDFA